MNAIFAMGCFWSAESAFRDHDTSDLLPGITAIRVGYAGGTQPNPTYPHHEGYKEAVKITFDPTRITYKQLLAIFWQHIDPFDPAGQFCDQGNSYQTVIYTENETQKSEAEASKKHLEKMFGKDSTVQITPFTTFYDAENFHQNYKANHPLEYNGYRLGCGRDGKLDKIWNNHQDIFKKNDE